MKVTKAHCFFEQSGTFKNEFIKLGVPAEDYDIQNEYGQTDHVIDLFKEVRGGYYNNPSVFDKIGEDELVFAFFPCTRFSCQSQLMLHGSAYQQRNMTDERKLEYAIKTHNELHELYELISMLAVVCLRKNIRLIIENPYSQPHYLTMYWCLRPSIIDNDRTERGDYYKKPTQFFFIGCKPENNIIMEQIEYVETRNIEHQRNENGKSRQTLRSEIHPQYANRFIREHILDA